ncbi:MAG: hypothetical protein Tsb0010_17570 [Parvularculaceae bacterium]
MKILVLSAYPIERRALSNICAEIAGAENVTSVAGFDEFERLTDFNANTNKFDLAVVAVPVAEHDLKKIAANAVNKLSGAAIVIFSMPTHGIHKVMDCKTAGVRGFILKTASESVILHALKLVAEGADYFPTEFGNVFGVRSAAAGGLAEDGASPTPRQLEVLRLVADGRSNEEIAETLGMSLATIKAEIQKACLILDARNRTHAVVRALNQRLIRFPE